MSIIEDWGSVEGLSRYRVSSLGRIKNMRTGRVLKHVPSASGTPMLCLQNDWNKQEVVPVKWLVVQAFAPQHVKARNIKNIDGDRSNVALSNLIVVER